MNVLEKIQELCNENGINPSRLEIELGFGKGTLYKWSKSVPKSDKLEKVANFFKVSVDYLLDRGNIYDMGKYIKEERVYQGFTVKELAKALEITESKLLQYEADEVPISEEMLNKIFEVLGISYDDFVVRYEIYDENTQNQVSEDAAKYDVYKKSVDKDDLKANTNTIFTTAQDAIKFILEQPVLMAFGGYDLDKMSDDEIIDFANELLRQFELISYKYKK